MSDNTLSELLEQIRACRVCEAELPCGPRPIVAASRQAKILIIGQAPGIRVHESGIPWDDPSGDRLREWMGVDKATFYDESICAIVPMGFCYPGTGDSGDLPPRKECAELWHQPLMQQLVSVKLTLVVGQFAQKYRLGANRKSSLTKTVEAWREFAPANLPLPHPSPRNNRWLKKNPWFGEDVLPYLRKRVTGLLSR
ncbi:MAG: uracil-DNA glycosylase family protein [Aureliella sp.]